LTIASEKQRDISAKSAISRFSLEAHKFGLLSIQIQFEREKFEPEKNNFCVQTLKGPIDSAVEYIGLKEAAGKVRY
jgi:hypothetical protein